MHDITSNFINLDAITILYLFGVGFVGGLVSGFIGSGGAFVLTPGMMSLGVPGPRGRGKQHVPQVPQGARRRHQAGQVRPGGREARRRARHIRGSGRALRRQHPGEDQGGLRRRRLQPLRERGLRGDPRDGRRLRSARCLEDLQGGHAATTRKRQASWQSGCSRSTSRAPWSISRASMPASRSCSPFPSASPRACWRPRSRWAASSAFLP